MARTAPSLTPEDRAQLPRSLTGDLRRFGLGGKAFEVVKRAMLGLFNDGFIHAGNLAYLALLTLFPFFITAAAVGAVFGQSAETKTAVASFLHVLPPNVAELLRKPIADVLAARTGRLLWLGGLIGLWTVSGFVETVREIFRRAYGVTAHLPFWRYRAGSTLVVIGSLVLAMVAFLVQGLLVGAEQVIDRLLPWAQELEGWIGLSRLVPGVVMFLALYILFYSVTPAKYRFATYRIWPGALFTTFWWVIATAALPPVLARLGSYDLTYGSLAGVVVMLLFFYVIGIGLVFGAHLNAALAEPADPALEATATTTAAEARA